MVSSSRAALKPPRSVAFEKNIYYQQLYTNILITSHQDLEITSDTFRKCSSWSSQFLVCVCSGRLIARNGIHPLLYFYIAMAMRFQQNRAAVKVSRDQPDHLATWYCSDTVTWAVLFLEITLIHDLGIMKTKITTT